MGSMKGELGGWLPVRGSRRDEVAGGGALSDSVDLYRGMASRREGLIRGSGVRAEPQSAVPNAGSTPGALWEAHRVKAIDGT